MVFFAFCDLGSVFSRAFPVEFFAVADLPQHVEMEKKYQNHNKRG
jgi:hypothetical protein